MRRVASLFAILASLALAAGLTVAVESPSQAASGLMSRDEWDWIDPTLPDASTLGGVEDNCNCTGNLQGTNPHNGNPGKYIKYLIPDTSPFGDDLGPCCNYALVFYVERDDSPTVWHVWKKEYCFAYDPPGAPVSQGCDIRP